MVPVAVGDELVPDDDEKEVTLATWLDTSEAISEELHAPKKSIRIAPRVRSEKQLKRSGPAGELIAEARRDGFEAGQHFGRSARQRAYLRRGNGSRKD